MHADAATAARTGLAALATLPALAALVGRAVAFLIATIAIVKKMKSLLASCEQRCL